MILKRHFQRRKKMSIGNEITVRLYILRIRSPLFPLKNKTQFIARKVFYELCDDFICLGRPIGRDKNLTVIMVR